MPSMSPGVQPFTQPHEWNLRQSHPRILRVKRPAVGLSGANQVPLRRRVEEIPMRFVGRAHQHVREPVLDTPVQGQRVAEVEPHGLAPAGDRDVQRTVGRPE